MFFKLLLLVLANKQGYNGLADTRKGWENFQGVFSSTLLLSLSLSLVSLHEPLEKTFRCARGLLALFRKGHLYCRTVWSTQESAVNNLA